MWYPMVMEESRSLSWFNLSWGMFLILAVIAFLGVMGFSLTISFVLGLAIAILCVWRFPFASLNIAFCSLLLSGIMVPISTGTIQIGERAFGANIEVTLGELITVVVMLGWALRLLLAQEREARVSARPWLPVVAGFGMIVLAQVLSALSGAQPDPLLVLKYALRPVLFVYLAAVALPANFIRSWRRIDEACMALVALGSWFALDGIRSLFIFGGDALGLYRAHPLTLFGVNPLGGNHHALAELMVLVAPLAWALSLRAHSERRAFVYKSLAGLFWLIALLTFARAAWLVVMFQLLVMSWFLWRSWVRRYWKTIAYVALGFLPFTLYMIWFSLQPGVEDSTLARTLLLDVSWRFFLDHFLVGVGAGTFPERLTHVWAFVVEFGAAEDAHGMIQKVGAETGLLGLSALGLTGWSVFHLVRGQWRKAGLRAEERAWFMCLVVAALGAFSYQLFSTSLWSPRVWISIGLLCAGMRLLQTNVLRRDPDFLQM